MRAEAAAKVVRIDPERAGLRGMTCFQGWQGPSGFQAPAAPLSFINSTGVGTRARARASGGFSLGLLAGRVPPLGHARAPVAHHEMLVLARPHPLARGGAH